MPPVVVFDACVLYPAPLRDLLMWLTSNRLIAARWSNEIFHEWVESLLLNRPDLKRERLERTCFEMNRAVPDGLVMGYESLIDSLELPDADDRHVLAAAIITNAQVILTLNLKDFPARQLPDGINAIAPDKFLCELFVENSDEVLMTMKIHRAALTKPSKSPTEYLDSLRNTGLIKFVDLVEPFQSDI